MSSSTVILTVCIGFGTPDYWTTSNRHPEALAAALESRITPQNRSEWVQGKIEDWVLEGHRAAQTVAYGDLGYGNLDHFPQ